MSFISAYVDDLIFVTIRDKGVLQKIKDELLERYKMTDLGQIGSKEMFLGTSVDYDQEKGTISIQKAY